MEVINNVLTATHSYPRVVLTIGSYDGVHLGHLSILNRVVAIAEETRGTAAVLTMRPHPRQFFSPEHPPNLLTSHGNKMALLAAAGIDVAFVLQFNADTASIEAPVFVEEIIRGRCHAEHLVVGHDFRFGKGAEGDFQLLETLGGTHGFAVEQAPALIIEGERVSSTLIRERVVQGDLVGVENLLGRKYSVTGEVVPGRGMGAKIGYPTANVRPDHSAVPAHGVYIAEAFIGGRLYPAAVNIGIAPTIRHEDVTIEAHILNYEGCLVGREIEIVFHRRLRPEKKFASIDELVAQIDRDVAVTRGYFEGGKSSL